MRNKVIILIAIMFVTIQHSFAQIPYATKDTSDYNRPINKTCSQFNFYCKPVKFNSKAYNYFCYNNNQPKLYYTQKTFTINFRIRKNY